MASKYRPLETHLLERCRGTGEITLSFNQLEKLLGFKLPASALRHREWWSNQTDVSNRPQAKAWGAGGFAVHEVNQDERGGWVRFMRQQGSQFNPDDLKTGSDWRKFQEYARHHMSGFFNIALTERQVPGVPKRFDLVSSDGQIVGDAKFLTLVRRQHTPPAKFMEIAGHVWLLESTSAKRRFLVFGNQREVPESWLRKYGKLVRTVEFYFLSNVGEVQRLN